MTKLMQPSSHLALVFWQWDIGGIQTRMTDVITTLTQKHKIRVTLLLRKKINKERALPQKSIHFQIVYCPRYLAWSRWLFFFWSIYSLYSYEPTHILTLLNRFHVIGSIAKWLLIFKGRWVRVVLNQPIFTSYYIAQFEGWYWKHLITFFYNKADRILVQTQAVADDLQMHFGVRRNLIKIIPNWTTMRAQTSEKFFDLVFIGRLSPEKGLSDFLSVCEAMAISNQAFRACIVGDGELRESLLSWLHSHKLQTRIWYAGYQQNALPWIAQSRVLCLFSKNEGMPMSVLEAMSMGVPVIVKDFPGATEVVTHGINGYVCGNHSHYLRAVQCLLSDNNRYKRFCRAAQTQVQKQFSLQNLDTFVTNLFSEDS